MVQANRIKTVALVGPTAVGKSETALNLAEIFNGEIVGADSMQIYRGFDIGTGKLPIYERRGIAHYMIDVCDGDCDFSVGEYVKKSSQVIFDIHSRGKLPIIVGGTGMYVYSLLSGCDFGSAPKNEGVRAQLKSAAHFFGGTTIHKLLTFVDKASADKISVSDVKRNIRALEIFALTGKPKSKAAGYSSPPYDALTIVLTLPREILYERINKRVKKMFDDGLIDETASLMQYKDCGSMQALGYKQIASNPDSPREELEPLVAQKTRNYSKRQMTYFKNMNLNKKFIDVRDTDKVISTVKEFLER